MRPTPRSLRVLWAAGLALAGGCKVPELTPGASTHVCTATDCAGTCDPGWADCDGDLEANGCETDLASTASCGACGVACDARETCARGACVPCGQAGAASCDAGADLPPCVLGSTLGGCRLQ